MEIGETKADWVEKVNPKVFEAAVTNYVPTKTFVPPTQEEKEDPNYVPPEPIELKIPAMTRDGNFDI